MLSKLGNCLPSFLLCRIFLVFINTGMIGSGLSLFDDSKDDLACAPDQFKCLHLNLNQILTMHDWNRHPRKCIPQTYRCDGRHDCQDGSDEVECFVQLPRRKSYRCFVGTENDMTVEDCIQRQTNKYEYHPHDISRSVSELKEWVCSKIDRPDGSIKRDCMSMYTGGESFDVCLTNPHDGKKCICSTELCNAAKQRSKPMTTLIFTTLLILVMSSNASV